MTQLLFLGFKGTISNMRDLHQRIGAIRKAAAQIVPRLEILDRVAESWLHPRQQAAKREAAALRRELGRLYTQLHHLEARIPTPETLSAAAFNRMIALGFHIEEAEAARVKTYREARALAA